MVRRMTVLLFIGVVVGLGWAVAVGRQNGWWAWPAWLVTLTVAGVMATAPHGQSATHDQTDSPQARE